MLISLLPACSIFHHDISCSPIDISSVRLQTHNEWQCPANCLFYTGMLCNAPISISELSVSEVHVVPLSKSIHLKKNVTGLRRKIPNPPCYTIYKLQINVCKVSSCSPLSLLVSSCVNISEQFPLRAGELYYSLMRGPGCCCCFLAVFLKHIGAV